MTEKEKSKRFSTPLEVVHRIDRILEQKLLERPVGDAAVGEVDDEEEIPIWLWILVAIICIALGVFAVFLIS